MIARARRQRYGIGLIAAYALLLSAWLPAFAAVADPLQAYLAAHLCGPSGAQGDTTPAPPADQQKKCQLCGPSCAMGGHALVAMLADGLFPVAALDVVTSVAAWPHTADPSALSRYPSDAFSQGPPQAA